MAILTKWKTKKDTRNSVVPAAGTPASAKPDQVGSSNLSALSSPGSSNSTISQTHKQNLNDSQVNASPTKDDQQQDKSNGAPNGAPNGMPSTIPEGPSRNGQPESSSNGVANGVRKNSMAGLPNGFNGPAGSDMAKMYAQPMQGQRISMSTGQLMGQPRSVSGSQQSFNNGITSPKPVATSQNSLPMQQRRPPFTQHYNPNIPQYPWSQQSIANATPFPRYGHASNCIAARDGEIFVMGGLKGSNVFGDLWVIETGKLFFCSQIRF